MGKNFKKLKKSRSRTLLPSAVSTAGSASSTASTHDKGQVSTTESRSREVTPPNTQQTLSPSAYNTPESAHPGSEGDPSPEDALLKTPTSIDEELSFVVPLSPELVQDGITGFDPSQALFDGTSKDNADFYIEIEDASMETAPDVRPYFWKLGQLQRGHTDLDIPGEHGKRITYDNDLVRTGREFLKSARRKGRGYFLNQKRYLLDHNKPEATWYRMPAVAFIEATFDEGNGLPAQEDEGTFYQREEDLDDFEGITVLTNIRAPCIFAKYERFPPGNAHWDASIIHQYSTTFFVHAARYCAMSPFDIVYETKLSEYHLTDIEAARAVLEEYWIKSPPSPTDLSQGGARPHERGWRKWLPWSS